MHEDVDFVCHNLTGLPRKPFKVEMFIQNLATCSDQGPSWLAACTGAASPIAGPGKTCGQPRAIQAAIWHLPNTTLPKASEGPRDAFGWDIMIPVAGKGVKPTLAGGPHPLGAPSCCPSLSSQPGDSGGDMLAHPLPDRGAMHLCVGLK